MHTRFVFLLIPFLTLTHSDLTAMEVALATRHPIKPSLSLSNNVRPLVQPKAAPIVSEKKHILNGHFNCTDSYTLLELGACAYQKNNFKSAKVFWKHVLNQPHQDQQATVVAWYNIGHAYYELNKPEKTEHAWEQAAQQEDDFFIKADALANLCTLFSLQEKNDKAQEKYDTLKDMLFNAQPKEDAPFHEAEAVYYLAQICANNNEYEEAVRYYNITLILLERIGWLHNNITTQAEAFTYLAKLATAEGDEKIAQRYQSNATYLLNPPSDTTKHEFE